MRKGQILKYNGDSVKVVSVNEDGTLTISHVGGKKKGFAGKIINPKHHNMISPKPITTVETNFGMEGTITLDQYESHAEPIDYAAIRELNRTRGLYFRSAAGNMDNLSNILTDLRELSITSGANFQDVIEGRCGIDECQYPCRSSDEPPHYPSSNCNSGQQPHCTCDACF